MKRREFITLLGGAAAAIPMTARAQGSAPAVVGVLSPEGPKTAVLMALSKVSASLAMLRGATLCQSLDRSRQKFSRARSCLDSIPLEASGMKAAVESVRRDEGDGTRRKEGHVQNSRRSPR